MKAKKLFSALFGGAGAVLLTVGILGCFWFQSGLDQARQLPQEALQVSQRWAEAISQGDLETAGSLTDSQIQLTAGEPAQSQVGALVWEAYTKSLSCTQQGDWVQSASGFSQEMTIASVDIPAVWTAIENQAAHLRAAQPAADAQALLLQAAREVLAGQVQTRQQTVTVSLCQQSGNWWIVWDGALRRALSGGLE